MLYIKLWRFSILIVILSFITLFIFPLMGLTAQSNMIKQAENQETPPAALTIAALKTELASPSTPTEVSTPIPAVVQATSVPSNETPALFSTSVAIAELESIISRIRKREYLKVGVQPDFPPFGFKDADGEIAGFDVDLTRAVAEVWGIRIEIVPILSEERIPALLLNEVDLVAAAMTHTKDRDAFIDFSQTYFIDGQGLLVRNDSGITGLEDLDGKRIAAIRGTTSIQEIQSFADNKGFQVQIVPFQDYPRALEAIDNGNVDALTTDQVALIEFAKANPTLTVIDETLTIEPYGIGMKAGDSVFRNLVDYTLQELKHNGTYDKIYESWFPGQEPYKIEILPGQWPCTFATCQTELITPTHSVIQKMQSEKKLIVGVMGDFPPFGTLITDNDCCMGFDIDIVKEFAKRWLGDEKAVKFEQLNPDERIPLLEKGEVDLVAGAMTQTWEREEKIDFSQTYFLDGQSLLVRKDSGISTMQDLQGERVAALLGTTSLDQIRDYIQTNGLNIAVVEFQNHTSAIEALLTHRTVDAFTTDRSALIEYANQNQELIVVGDTFTFEPYGIGIQANDYQLRDLINSTLQEMKLDGTYDRLYKKWLGDAPVTKIDIWPRKTYTSYLGFSQSPMVYIPDGEFIRGTEDGDVDERPVKAIFLDGFYIDQYEVTNRLYRECVAANVCNDPPRIQFSLGEPNDYYNNIVDYGNYPVIWVTWEQANRYCQFLGKRLPTEAEWEKAARGIQNYLFPWGNELLEEVKSSFAQYKDPVIGGSTAKDISDYGVYDMSGNVREWVNDFYRSDYYTVDAIENPLGPERAVRKVVRGGSWFQSTSQLWRSTSREGYLPTGYAADLGFRCASDKAPIQLVVQN
jgi:ABC-type amino acid transport substrate-binding protein